MRATFIATLLLLLTLPASTPASAQSVGKPLPSFTLKDLKGNSYTLASFKQPVLLFVYQGKVSWKQNLHVTRALEKMTATGKLPRSKYRGIGISNFQESAAPNALIRAILRMVTKRSKMLLLLDESGGMRKLWGFRNGRSNIYVLDHKRRLRWRSSGPLTKRRTRQLLRLIRRLVRSK